MSIYPGLPGWILAAMILGELNMGHWSKGEETRTMNKTGCA